MLLHKRRLQANLNGIGYVNPYAIDRPSALYVQPLKYDEYPKSLLLVTEEYHKSKLIKEKDDFKKETNKKDELVPTLNLGKILGVVAKDEKKFVEDKTGSGHSKQNMQVISHTGSYFKELLQVYNTTSSTDDTDTMNIYGDYSIPNYKLDPNTNNVQTVVKTKKLPLIKITESSETTVPKIHKKTAIKDNIEEQKSNPIEMVGKGAAIKVEKNKHKDVRKMGKYPSSYLKNKLLKQYKKSRDKLINIIE